MRACVQRVRRAVVRVGDEVVGEIEKGLFVLLGVGHEDTAADVAQLAKKIAHLRVFNDADGKMNLGLLDIGGSVLVVSQFTLMGDCRKGRRPSFVAAADPPRAEELYEQCVAAIAGFGVPVATGIFQANMQIELVNDGPVTLLLDSQKLF